MDSKMNERIKQLAKQSLPEFYLTNCPSALEKFAELIVRECAQVGFDYNGGTVCEIYAVILEHFGVEE
jgi:hypothetical protein